MRTTMMAITSKKKIIARLRLTLMSKSDHQHGRTHKHRVIMSMHVGTSILVRIIMGIGTGKGNMIKMGRMIIMVTANNKNNNGNTIEEQ